MTDLQQDIAYLIQQLRLDIMEAKGDRKRIKDLLQGYKKDLEALEEEREDVAYMNEPI